MKSVVEVEIDMPLQEVAELLADPRNNPHWMHNVKSYEPVSGLPPALSGQAIQGDQIGNVR